MPKIKAARAFGVGISSVKRYVATARGETILMASELLGYLGRAKSLPARRDDPGSYDPVVRRVAATSKSPDLPFFFETFGRAGTQQLRHVLYSFLVWRFGHALMCTAFEERSTRPVSNTNN